MAFISLGEINKAFIPLIVGCIICFLNRLVNQYEYTELFDHPIIMNVFIAFSKLFAIIPLIILKKNSKKSSARDIGIINNNTKKLIYNNPSFRIIKGKLRYILLSAVIFLIY